ncbi:MAG: peroxiredoxin [Cyclonatronaceae bacterium]
MRPETPTFVMQTPFSLLLLTAIFLLSTTSSDLSAASTDHHSDPDRPSVGDPAPEFEAMTDEGEMWRSADHEGGILVVFFFPAAMTGGCTAQACSFRDNRSELVDMGAEVVGISGDQIRNLQLFRRTNNLNFPLLSDADGSIARDFGVPVRDGGTFTTEVDGEQVELTRNVTTSRWTFIIDEEGRIAYVDTEVNASVDSEAVLSALRDMTDN